MRVRKWARPLIAGALLLSGASAFAADIEWQVKDRFRLFGQADETSRARVETLLDRLASAPPGSLAEQHDALLEVLGGPEAGSLRGSNWNQSKRTYSPAYLYPDRYAIVATVTGAQPGNCWWTVEGKLAAEAPCAAPVELSIPARTDEGRWSGRAKVSVTDALNQRRETQVAIQDRLIVAMGDSYISGEGNPDVPADLSRLEPSARFARKRWPGTLDARRDPVRIAQWWDEPCHRSLLSWPVIAGLRQAAADPHGAVTLVHLACSSATTLQGLTLPQRNLSGCPVDMDARRNCPPRRRETLSQIDQLTALVKQSGKSRPVDKLFLSVGGIDIGFKGLVAYGVLPTTGYPLGSIIPSLLPLFSSEEIVCPYRTDKKDLSRFCWRRRSAEERLGALPARYGDIADKMRDAGIGADAVVIMTYPDAMSAGDGLLCHHALAQYRLKRMKGDPLKREEEYRTSHGLRELPAGFEALGTLIPGIARGLNRWDFHFNHPAGAPCDAERPSRTDSEMCKLNWVRLNLNRRIASAAKDNGWGLVSSHEKAIEGHGWCMADDTNPLALPVARLDGGKWSWNSDLLQRFDAYDARQERWFRTANDSLMTQFGGTGRIVQGTVHPTFRAHLVYAEAAAE